MCIIIHNLGSVLPNISSDREHDPVRHYHLSDEETEPGDQVTAPDHTTSIGNQDSSMAHCPTDPKVKVTWLCSSNALWRGCQRNQRCWSCTLSCLQFYMHLSEGINILSYTCFFFIGVLSKFLFFNNLHLLQT